MGLRGRLVPDHETIADFRRDNGSPIRKTCAQVVELCRRIGTQTGDCVAIDASRVKAVNNRDRNVTKGKIASRPAHPEADVEGYITETVRNDRQAEGGAPAEGVAHPFGSIEAWMGTTHFLMRRLAILRTEMALNVLTCNIKRMVALVGIKGQMAAIPA